MQLSDFTLTPAQQDELLAQEINQRVRKGATLLAVNDGTAVLRYGRETGTLDLVYIVMLWVFQIALGALTLGLSLIVLAVIWGLFRKLWRKGEGVKVHETGQVEVYTFGKTLMYITEANLRRQQA